MLRLSSKAPRSPALVLADLSELTLARLDRCFDDPIPNPGRAPER